MPGPSRDKHLRMMGMDTSEPKAYRPVPKAETGITVQLDRQALKSRFFGQRKAMKAAAVKPVAAWFPKPETPVVKKPFKLSDLVKKK
jgi:hypothetical protein